MNIGSLRRPDANLPMLLEVDRPGVKIGAGAKLLIGPVSEQDIKISSQLVEWRAAQSRR